MLSLNEIKEYRCPRWDQLPDIDLYMDQVLVVLDKYLRIFKETEDEKIITSAMINNYVKQKITKPPVNKKYTRYHVAFLYVVCVLKNFVSLSDICIGVGALLDGRHSAEAFDMFCAEFDAALAVVFGDREDNRPKPTTDVERLLRAMTMASANMLYGKYFISLKAAQLAEVSKND